MVYLGLQPVGVGRSKADETCIVKRALTTLQVIGASCTLIPAADGLEIVNPDLEPGSGSTSCRGIRVSQPSRLEFQSELHERT